MEQKRSTGGERSMAGRDPRSKEDSSGNGIISVYTGEGKGKSSAAIGRAVKAAAEGKAVVVIQFLKGKGLGDYQFLRRMEPEIKIFRFEKSNENFDELPEGKKREEIKNLKNGICFAKKVLTTGECDLLVLDEILGLLENGILTMEEFRCLLENRGDTHIMLTGICLTEDICAAADEVFRIETVKTLE
ncbi:MAG: cob(I)yrinic acid a,c-diamide adenosyltransferase [Clostridium sp.]|jgi:cob(I)alamin adenosyltransferase|nr:cob(I)yrinic acid a,c-diamide adenosyltransferase [Clostridium sp.]